MNKKYLVSKLVNLLKEEIQLCTHTDTQVNLIDCWTATFAVKNGLTGYLCTQLLSIARSLGMIVLNHWPRPSPFTLMSYCTLKNHFWLPLLCSLKINTSINGIRIVNQKVNKHILFFKALPNNLIIRLSNLM